MGNRRKRLIIFISGRGSNMEAILDACEKGVLKELAEVVCVYSNRMKAEGLTRAGERAIPTHCIPSFKKERADYDKELARWLSEQTFDYIILAGYMRVMSDFLVKAYPGQIINIHPADTAKHQGLGAYKWAYDNQLTETTITVHFVDEGLDTGKVIAKKRVPLQNIQTLDDVRNQGLAIEHTFYSEAIKLLLTKPQG